MKVTLHNTTKIIEFNGIPCRVWEGTTDTGIKVHAFITRVAVDKAESEEVHQQFRTELHEMSAPSPEIESFPLRMIL